MRLGYRADDVRTWQVGSLRALLAAHHVGCPLYELPADSPQALCLHIGSERLFDGLEIVDALMAQESATWLEIGVEELEETGYLIELADIIAAEVAPHPAQNPSQNPALLLFLEELTKLLQSSAYIFGAQPSLVDFMLAAQLCRFDACKQFFLVHTWLENIRQSREWQPLLLFNKGEQHVR